MTDEAKLSEIKKWMDHLESTCRFKVADANKPMHPEAVVNLDSCKFLYHEVRALRDGQSEADDEAKQKRCTLNFWIGYAAGLESRLEMPEELRIGMKHFNYFYDGKNA